MATPLLLQSEFLDPKECCVGYHGVDKAFCKSVDDSFDGRAAFREGKSVSRVSVYSIDRTLPFHDRSAPM